MTYYARDPKLILKHLAAVRDKDVTIHPQHWCIVLYSKDPTILANCPSRGTYNDLKSVLKGNYIDTKNLHPV